MKRNVKGLFIGFLVMAMMLSGCIGQSSNTQRAETAVTGMFEALKGTDVEELKRYVYDIGNTKSNDAGVLIYQHMTYRIISSREESEDTVLVNTEITALNNQELITEIMKQVYANNTKSDGDYMNILKQILDSGNISTITQTVDIRVKNYSGTWKVCYVDSDLVNALAGQTSN